VANFVVEHTFVYRCEVVEILHGSSFDSVGDELSAFRVLVVFAGIAAVALGWQVEN
jgi:hypothetical protein